MKIYRLYDPETKSYVSSGRSLYAKNGRSLWLNRSGALNAKKNLADDVRARVELVTYELVEIDREESDWKPMPRSQVHTKIVWEQIETGDLHGDS